MYVYYIYIYVYIYVYAPIYIYIYIYIFFFLAPNQTLPNRCANSISSAARLLPGMQLLRVGLLVLARQVAVYILHIYTHACICVYIRIYLDMHISIHILCYLLGRGFSFIHIAL